MADGFTLERGDRLGPYEVLDAVGSGGMGEIYRARDTRLDRTVAIKVLPRRLADSPDHRDWFEREARAISRISHPHICTLHDLGHDADVDFLVLEYIEGETLAERIRRGPVPWKQAVAISEQTADALAVAHRAGVVHRDLKPANIMLTRDGAKLLDFGVARLIEGPVEERAEVTRPTGSVGTAGTVHYMAPEQLRGAEADHRMDLWALGLLIHEMITGQRVFETEGSGSPVQLILEQDPVPVRSITPDVPASLEQLVLRCLVKDPEARWQSAADLAYRLGEIGRGEAGPGEPGRSIPGGGRALLAAMALIAIAAVAFAFLQGAPEYSSPVSGRFTLVPPAGVQVLSPRLAPDGKQVCLSAVSDGQVRLWVRRLDESSWRSLPGTEGARWYHSWAPDGQSVLFFADGELRRVDLSGGPPRTVSDLPGPGPIQGCSWGASGTILFNVIEVPGVDGLYAIPAGGGEAQRLNLVDEQGRTVNALMPSFLPDGERFVFIGYGAENPGLEIYRAPKPRPWKASVQKEEFMVR